MQAALYRFRSGVHPDPAPMPASRAATVRQLQPGRPAGRCRCPSSASACVHASTADGGAALRLARVNIIIGQSSQLACRWATRLQRRQGRHDRHDRGHYRANSSSRATASASNIVLRCYRPHSPIWDLRKAEPMLRTRRAFRRWYPLGPNRRALRGGARHRLPRLGPRQRRHRHSHPSRYCSLTAGNIVMARARLTLEEF